MTPLCLLLAAIAIVIIATAIISATMAVILYAACVIAGGVPTDSHDD